MIFASVKIIFNDQINNKNKYFFNENPKYSHNDQCTKRNHWVPSRCNTEDVFLIFPKTFGIQMVMYHSELIVPRLRLRHEQFLRKSR